MVRKRTAWPVLLVADRQRRAQDLAQLDGDGVVGVVRQELVERVRLGDEADDRDEHEHERNRRQERVVGELAGDLGDVVAHRAADRPGHAARPARRPPGGPATSPCAPTNPRWRGSPIARWISVSPARRKAGTRPQRPAGGVIHLTLRVARAATGPSSRGARPRNRGSCCPRGSSYCPPRGSSEARGARAQRHGPPGHRSHGNEVERRDGPHIFPGPPVPAAGRVRGRVRIGFVGAGLMGSGMVRNLAAAGHEVRALRPFALARAGTSPRALAGSVRRGGRRRRPGVPPA